MIMSFGKNKYLFLLSCCAFVSCNNENSKEQQNNETEKDQMDDPHKNKSVAVQKVEASKNISELKTMISSIIDNSKQFPKEQEEHLLQFVKLIKLNFNNALQNGKPLNYETINKFYERLKKFSKSINDVKFQKLFFGEIFSLAKYLHVDKSFLENFKKIFLLEEEKNGEEECFNVEEEEEYSDKKVEEESSNDEEEEKYSDAE